LKPVA